MADHKTDHICARQAICFRCFKAGVDRTRARQDAWAQRSLPFDVAPPPSLTPRELQHRRQMLEHLTAAAGRSR